MKQGSYQYPPDEFDAAARAGGPRGVHRAPRSRWSRWWPFLVVLVVFPALAYAGVTILSDWDGLSGGDSAEEPEDAAAEEPEDAAEEEPADPETPADEPTTEEPAPPPPPLDQARPVDVYNSTGRSGLAGNAADRLEAAGFSDVSALNWESEDPAASIVYYGVATDITTAQTVGSTLGIAQVVESAELAPEGIVVVLAGDYVAT